MIPPAGSTTEATPARHLGNRHDLVNPERAEHPRTTDPKTTEQIGGECSWRDQTLVALYDDAVSARQVLDQLRAAGLLRPLLDQRKCDGDRRPGVFAVLRLRRRLRHAAEGSRVQSLIRLGVPESDAHLYAEGVRRGSRF